MQVRLIVDSADELGSLRNWLAEDSAVCQNVRVEELWDPGQPGQMNALAVLSLVLGSGISIAQLIAVIATWRASRPKPAVLRIQVGGRSVEVATELTDLASVAAQLEAELVGKPEAG